MYLCWAVGVVKGWFPYDLGSQIADRRSVADRNKVCDRLRSYGNTSAIVGDPAIDTIAEDRTMFYLKAGFHMIADDRRRSQIANNRRRSQKRLFPYNRNDRRADRSHTFWSAEMSNIHARVG